MAKWGRAATAGSVALSLCLLFGCSAGTEGDPGPGPGSQAPPSSAPGDPSGAPTTAPPAPKTLTAAEYRAQATAAVRPVQDALGSVADAKKPKSVQTRTTGVSNAAAKAVTQLQALAPPAELAAPHAQLLSALGAFRTTTGGLSAKVGSRALCTGSAVTIRVGDAGATAALRKAAAAASIKLKLPAANQKADARPSNGKFVRSGTRNGNGELTIDNGGSADAVLTLVKGGDKAFSVFVRKGKKTTVKGVPNGNYVVYFAGGKEWDTDTRSFGGNCSFAKFEDKLKFTTKRMSGGISYSRWQLTLQPVIGGNARTSDVDPDDFPN